MVSPEERIAELVAARISSRWIKLREAACHSKIPEGRLIALADEGTIIGFRDPDNGRGDWIFDRDSLDSYRLSQYKPGRIRKKVVELLSRHGDLSSS